MPIDIATITDTQTGGIDLIDPKLPTGNITTEQPAEPEPLIQKPTVRQPAEPALPTTKAVNGEPVKPPAKKINREYADEVWAYFKANPNLTTKLNKEAFLAKYFDGGENQRKLYEGLRREKEKIPTLFALGDWETFVKSSFSKEEPEEVVPVIPKRSMEEEAIAIATSDGLGVTQLQDKEDRPAPDKLPTELDYTWEIGKEKIKPSEIKAPAVYGTTEAPEEEPERTEVLDKRFSEFMRDNIEEVNPLEDNHDYYERLKGKMRLDAQSIDPEGLLGQKFIEYVISNHIEAEKWRNDSKISEEILAVMVEEDEADAKKPPVLPAHLPMPSSRWVEKINAKERANKIIKDGKYDNLTASQKAIISTQVADSYYEQKEVTPIADKIIIDKIYKEGGLGQMPADKRAELEERISTGEINQEQAQEQFEKYVGEYNKIAEEAYVEARKIAPPKSTSVSGSLDYVLKSAINTNSLGLAIQIMAGEPIFEMYGYEPSKLEEISGEVASLATDPLMYLTGGVGSLGAKMVTRGIAMKLLSKGGGALERRLIASGTMSAIEAKAYTKMAINTRINQITLQATRVGGGGIGLGGWSAGNNALQQRLSTNSFQDIEWSEVLSEGVINSVLGGSIGVLGNIGGRVEGVIERSMMNGYQQGFMKWGAAKPIEFIAENAMFVYGGAAMRGEQATLDDLMHSFALLGGLKITSAIRGLSSRYVKSEAYKADKINKGIYNAEFTPEEIKVLGAGKTSSAILNEVKTNPESFMRIMESKDVPQIAKDKIMWAAAGMIPKEGAGQFDKVTVATNEKGEGILSVWREDGQRIDMKKFKNIDDASRASMIMAFRIKEEHNKNKVESLTPEEKVVLEDKMVEVDSEKLDDALNILPELRTKEEKALVSTLYQEVEKIVSARKVEEKVEKEAPAEEVKEVKEEEATVAEVAKEEKAKAKEEKEKEKPAEEEMLITEEVKKEEAPIEEPVEVSEKKVDEVKEEKEPVEEVKPTTKEIMEKAVSKLKQIEKEVIKEETDEGKKIAEEYLTEMKEPSDLSHKERVIAGSGFVTTGKSFAEFGDKNKVTASMARTFFKKEEGKTLDVIAEELSETAGVEITTQDMAEFMEKYPSGRGYYDRSSRAKELAVEYQEITGKNLNRTVAAKVLGTAKTVKEAEQDGALKSTDIRNILDEFVKDDNTYDFEKLVETAKKDPGFFTQFPYGLTEAELQKLKDYATTKKGQRSLQKEADKADTIKEGVKRPAKLEKEVEAEPTEAAVEKRGEQKVKQKVEVKLPKEVIERGEADVSAEREAAKVEEAVVVGKKLLESKNVAISAVRKKIASARKNLTQMPNLGEGTKINGKLMGDYILDKHKKGVITKAEKDMLIAEQKELVKEYKEIVKPTIEGGLEQAGRGFEELMRATGGLKGIIAPEQRPDVLKALTDIAVGLARETGKKGAELIDEVKKFLKEKGIIGINDKDVDKLSKAILKGVEKPEKPKKTPLQKKIERVVEGRPTELIQDYRDLKSSLKEPKGFRAGKRAEKKNVSERRAMLENFIKENSDRINKLGAKLSTAILRRVNNIKTEKTLADAISYIDGILSKQEFRNDIIEIEKTISLTEKLISVKLEKGNKPKGKRIISEYDIKTNGKQLSKLSHEILDNRIADVLLEIEEASVEGTGTLLNKYAQLEYAKKLKEYGELKESFADMNMEELKFTKEDLSKLREYFERTNQSWLEKTKQEQLKKKIKKQRDIKLLVDGAKKRKRTEELPVTSSEYAELVKKERIFHPLKRFESLEGIIETVFGLSGVEPLNKIKELTSNRVTKGRREHERAGNVMRKMIKEAEKLLDEKISNRRLVQSEKLGYIMISNTGKRVGDLRKMSYMDIAMLTSTLKDRETYQLFKNTYSSKSIKGLQEHLESVVSENKSLGDFIKYQEEVFYPKVYEMVNEVYRRLYNADMPRVDGIYVPRSVIDRISKDLDFEMNQPLMQSFIVPANIKTRRKGRQKINVRKDALNVMVNYAQTMQDFIAFAEVKRDLIGYFKNPEVKKAISQVRDGKFYMKIIERFIENMPRNKMDITDQKSIGWAIFRNIVMAPLSLNITMPAKQISSLPNFIVDMPTKKGWQKLPLIKEGIYVREVFNSTGWAEYLKEFYGGDFIDERLRGGFDRDLSLATNPIIANLLIKKMPYGEKIAKLIKLIKNDIGMGFLKVGDVGAFLGGKPIYTYVKKATYEQLIKEGKTKEEAERSARQVAADAVASMGEKVQQSKYTENMSYFQLGKSARLFPYMTTQIQYMQQVSKALRNLTRGQGTADDIRRLFNYGVLQPYIYKTLGTYLYVLMGGEEEEEVEGGDLDNLGKILGVLSNTIQGVPVAYDVAQYYAANMQGKKTYQFRISASIDRLDRTLKSLEKTYNVFIDKEGNLKPTSEISNDDWEKIEETGISLSEISGIGTSNIMKAISLIRTGSAYKKKKEKQKVLKLPTRDRERGRGGGRGGR